MSVLVWGLATMKIDPPWPPSPPLGPPRGTNFSRRNARHPRPPPPAATWMSTSSTNTLLERLNTDHAAVCAVVLELHAARDLGEDRVVFAEAGIQPGAEAAAALAHDNRAAGHDVAVVGLDAEPLRVRVAPVARAALSF